jgi:magnesium chelatase family protein
MLAKIESRSVLGIEAKKVDVEVDIAGGLPCFTIVGLADTAVKESRDRVISAIKNSGFKFPPKKITINLAPADLRKEGAGYYLAIALGILVANGEFGQELTEGMVICGELSLDGGLRPINGVLPVAMGLAGSGSRGLVIPHGNSKEAGIVRGVAVYAAASLREVVEFLKGACVIDPVSYEDPGADETPQDFDIDFSDVKGQWHVKRGLEVAAAGGHNVLMIGPPGSGKTMLAQRLTTILPGLSLGEMLETTKIHSVSGLLSSSNHLVLRRPFRMPHHTVSYAGLVGGGSRLKPGEISLAHNGVLFLDELPEFRRDALEALRQPLEGGEVIICRAASSLKYPAKFMLVAAMNPCPCGYFTDPKKECHCTPPLIQRYLSKVSGPLLDRIDIHLEVPSLRYKELSGKSRGESSEAIRERVNTARAAQKKRYEGLPIYCNAHLGSKETEKYCSIDKEATELLKLAILELGLSARGYDKVLKIARTIADLAGPDTISAEHISEAINYRSLDRDLGF